MLFGTLSQSVERLAVDRYIGDGLRIFNYIRSTQHFSASILAKKSVSIESTNIDSTPTIKVRPRVAKKDKILKLDILKQSITMVYRHTIEYNYLR